MLPRPTAGFGGVDAMQVAQVVLESLYKAMLNMRLRRKFVYSNDKACIHSTVFRSLGEYPNRFDTHARFVGCGMLEFDAISRILGQ